MARNAFGLALLTALTLSGCSQLDNLPFVGNKDAKEAEAKMVALRARTDSLRKARRLADSLAQVRFTACADSVRTEMNKSPVVKAKKKKKKAPAFAPPSEQLIVTQVQVVCSNGATGPQATIATADTAAARPAAAESIKPSAPAQPAPAAEPVPAPAAVAAEVPAAAAPASAQADPATLQVQDTGSVDSLRKAKELEMSRETFAYSGAARDPFNSLLNMAKNGPELADLQLVGIYQNLRAPSASVAVFREKDGGKRHKLRAGDQVGRSRLVQIRDRDVVFMIEDFGFERQETLSLRKQEDVTP